MALSVDFSATGSPYSMLVQGAYAVLRKEIVQYMMQPYRKRPTRKGAFDIFYGVKEKLV